MTGLVLRDSRTASENYGKKRTSENDRKKRTSENDGKKGRPRMTVKKGCPRMTVKGAGLTFLYQKPQSSAADAQAGFYL